MDSTHAMCALFGRQVRLYRRHHGWTQKTLAGLVGTTETSLSRIEQGKQNVCIADIVQLADALHVGVPVLFGAVVVGTRDPILDGLVTHVEHLLTKVDELRQAAAHIGTVLGVSPQAESACSHVENVLFPSRVLAYV